MWTLLRGGGRACLLLQQPSPTQDCFQCFHIAQWGQSTPLWGHTQCHVTLASWPCLQNRPNPKHFLLPTWTKMLPSTATHDCYEGALWAWVIPSNESSPLYPRAFALAIPSFSKTTLLLPSPTSGLYLKATQKPGLVVQAYKILALRSKDRRIPSSRPG